MTAQSAREFSGTRTVARKLALQALYRWQLNACPWQDLLQEFGEAEDMARADREYFRALIEGVWRTRLELD
ncbi:MAG TPA: transcription antitermination factor NusB, partial [Steroidobacteraceae bacterium]